MWFRDSSADGSRARCKLTQNTAQLSFLAFLLLLYISSQRQTNNRTPDDTLSPSMRPSTLSSLTKKALWEDLMLSERDGLP